jgi:hypothetical protein
VSINSDAPSTLARPSDEITYFVPMLRRKLTMFHISVSVILLL